MTNPVDDFKDAHGEALAQAITFSKRRKRGLPPDRWATTRELHLVAQGIDAQNQIIAMQSDVILGLLAEMGAANADTAAD